MRILQNAAEVRAWMDHHRQNYWRKRGLEIRDEGVFDSKCMLALPRRQ